MDQKPLPRGSLQICDRTGQERRVVPELPQAAVAVEAQYPAHPTGAMIVINVFRVVGATDGAAAARAANSLTVAQSGQNRWPSGTATRSRTWRPIFS
jgi:hypothetical protein